MNTEEINQQEEKNNPKYMSGFNSGYLIAEHEPELSKSLVVSLQNIERINSPYVEGVQEGILHHELEKVQDRYKDYQMPDRGIIHDKDKGRTKE